MTTKVTITASGINYPARVTYKRGDGITESYLVYSGKTQELWVGTRDSLLVTEEYHPDAAFPVPE